MKENHFPVLLRPSSELLGLKSGDKIIDATLGLGGHSLSFSETIGSTGFILALDLDRQAIKLAKEKLKDSPAKIKFKQANFSEIENIWQKLFKKTKANSIFFDLGFNSTQLYAGRGFSFDSDDRLLMSYDDHPQKELTAWEIINEWEEENLADIIYAYGEETYARKIAANIIKKRNLRPINTARELAEIVSEIKKRRGRIHPATKTFQALRITVNDELESLKKGLAGAWNILKENGTLGVISFHGLEARIVRDFFKEKQSLGIAERIGPKIIKPSAEELKLNPRSRSAQLRIIKKIV